MRYSIFAFILLTFTSCISSKKYYTLQTNYNALQNELQYTNQKISECFESNKSINTINDSLHHLIQIKSFMIYDLDNKSKQQTLKITNFESELFSKSLEIKNLNKRIEELTLATKINADIMKRTFEELNNQNLKVLNLSLALQKHDTLNPSSVKKTSNNLTDEKLKKSLEKVGFVFY